MKSPLTGKEMPIVKEERVLEFRKEKFEVTYHFYKCEESGEQFTDDALENLNVNQVHNQYRAKYGIPFVDEIKQIREKYGLSAAKMSEVLGLGANVYRQYEAGEIPSVATGRLIRMAEDPKEFFKLLEIGKNALDEHEYNRVRKKVEDAMSGWAFVDEYLESWLFRYKTPNEFNGYKVPSLHKIGMMVKFFAQTVAPFTTGMNKLMFYGDFLHFKLFGNSISGLSYHAIQRGPVPVNYGGIYNQLCNLKYVDVQEEDFGEFVGEQFHSVGEPVKLESVDSLFSNSEVEVLAAVVKKLGKLPTKRLVDLSHREDGWKENKDQFEQINYRYAFDLKAFD